MRDHPASRYAALIVLAAVGAVFLAPLVWMISTSVKPQEEVTTTGISLLPADPTKIPQYAYENYYAGRPKIVDARGLERVGYEGVLTSENVHFVNGG